MGGVPVTAIGDLLDGLEAAASAATPGPWDFGPNWTGGWALARASIEDADGMPVHTPSGWTGADAACIVAEHNAAPVLVAAIRAVLAMHVPWYEINGVREEHTVTKPCYEDECDCEGDGHEVPACAECRWSDGDLDGYLVWPCPTVRAVLSALGASS